MFQNYYMIRRLIIGVVMLSRFTEDKQFSYSGMNCINYDSWEGTQIIPFNTYLQRNESVNK